MQAAGRMIGRGLAAERRSFPRVEGRLLRVAKTRTAKTRELLHLCARYCISPALENIVGQAAPTVRPTNPLPLFLFPRVFSWCAGFNIEGTERGWHGACI